MKRFISIGLLIATLSAWSQPIPQTKKVTEKFFPDLDLTINTPAFQKEKGFTDYEELIAFLDQKVVENPGFIEYTFIGSSQKGRRIPIVTITNPAVKDGKLKVWMQGGLHGNEPASTEGLLYLIDRIMTEPDQRALLDKLVIQMVPMINIDGYLKQDRYAANGLDLNRDHTKLNVHESVLLKTAYNAFNPEVAVDFHEYRPYRRDFARMSDWGVTSSFDVMFLYTGNLNVPAPLRALTESRFIDPAKKVMADNGLRYSDYMTSTDYHGETQFNLGAVNPRSSATAYALSNCVSTLIEVRGVALGRRSYKRRVFTTYTIALSHLQSAALHAVEVREVLARVEKNNDREVVVTSVRKRESRKVPFIDIGTNEIIEVDAIVRNALESKPGVTRERPTAYLILPGNEAAIEKLKTLGLHTRELDREKRIEVESYTVVEYKRDTYPYEGIHLQKVKTEVKSISKTFPVGTCIIETDQEKSNLSVAVLEPESTSSFVNFEVIKTAMGNELPVYRYLKKEEL